MYKLSPIVSLTIILSLFCGGCTGKDTSVLDFFLGSKIPAYGELRVTEQWQEIKLGRAVVSGRPVRFIVLQIKDGDKWQEFNGNIVKNSQGDLVNVRAQLIDEQGRTYELESNSGRPEQIHVSINYENWRPGEPLPKPITGEADKEVTFRKLRIKSNYSFTCSEIYWESRAN